jgi:xanthine/uracil permease
MAGKRNLTYGVILIVLSIIGSVAVTAEKISGPNLTGSIVLIFLFVFVGAYEIGKYAENRIENQYKNKVDGHR